MGTMRPRSNQGMHRDWGGIWRLVFGALLVSGMALLLASCSSSMVDEIQVSPSSQSMGVGQTFQFTALGVIGHGNHPSTTEDVTDLVAWSSSTPTVATINATGLATGVGAGSTTITAKMNGFTGVVTATATLTVTGSSGGGGGGNPTVDVTSISVIPGAQSVAAPGGTAQFIPIGTTSAGSSINLAGHVTWNSSSQQIATISAAGIATAVSQGNSTITALYTNADSTVATGTATFQVISGTAEKVTALTLFPTSQSATAVGQQSQFTVLGTENGLQYDVTGQVVWASSIPSVATIGTAGNGTPGLATAVGNGSTTITATYTNSDNSQVVATGTLSVSIGTGQEPLLSINIVPSGTTVSNKGMTGQYLAFGTYSTAPTVRDITNTVNWISLLPEVASINSYGLGGPAGSGGSSGELGGLATAQGYTGDTVIYAEATNPDGTVVLSNPQTFTCKDPSTNVCDQSVATPQFATITVFVEGENTAATGEYVTAPSDTGTPNLIHCGPDWTGSGGQVCTGTYAVGSTVTLTENLPSGSSYFGGWSTGSACAEAGSPENLSILATTTTCTVTLSGNASVGVIFY